MDEYKDLIKKGMNYLDLNNLSTVGERDYKLDDLPDLSKILNEFLNQTSNRKKFHDQNEIQKLLKKTIQSGIGFNNLLTGIQTYQMYKINKNTKSLRS
jgi:hypothetical protein